MNFEHPWILFFLILPALLAGWEWKRRGYRVRLPMDHSRIAGRPILGRLVNSTNLLPALIVATGIIILAGPQKAITGRLTQERRNIHFLLDVSGSMSLKYGKSNRYSAAMKAITQFTNYRSKDDAFALSVFGSEVIHWIPLTQEVSAIELAEPFLDPKKISSYMGGTRIGNALWKILPIMQKEDGDRMIILLTDGQSSDLMPDQVYKVTKALKDAQITVYSVFTGNDNAPDALRIISESTRGELFTPGDPDALNKTFKHIAMMKKVKSQPFVHAYMAYFRLAAIIGLCLLGITVLAGFGLRYTPW